MSLSARIPSAPPGSLHSTLRQATRPDHEALDRAFARFALDTHEGYGAFLSAHLGALSRLRDACDVAAHGDVRTLIDHLRTDLSRMSYPVPPESIEPDRERAFGTRFEQAGATYVIRGSRLGAVFVRKQVRAGFPMDYLARELSMSWPAFVSGLDALGVDARAADVDGAVDAARSTFAVFAAYAGR